MLCNRVGIISVQIRKYRLIFGTWSPVQSPCAVWELKLSQNKWLKRKDIRVARSKRCFMTLFMSELGALSVWNCALMQCSRSGHVLNGAWEWIRSVLVVWIKCRCAKGNEFTGTLFEVEHVQLKRYSDERRDGVRTDWHNRYEVIHVWLGVCVCEWEKDAVMVHFYCPLNASCTDM